MSKLVPALLIAVLFAACAGEPETAAETEAPATSSPTAVATPSPTPEPSPEPTPDPRVELAWSWTDPEQTLVRFVALVTNDGPEPLVGVETEWIAYDDSGAIIGSFSSERPAIAPGETLPYVGGAGGANLSGTPARVEVNLTSPGRFAAVETPRLEVSDVELSQDEFAEALEYRVGATVTVGDTAVSPEDLDIYIVLRDAAGEVVGGDWYDADNLPSSVPAGSTFRIDAGFIAATAEPATADVVVVVR